MEKIELIAEIGWSHCGDMSLAKAMIESAFESGADYAKFQTWSVSKLKNGPWDNDGRRKLYEKAELTEERHYELKEHCKSVGIKFLTSCFSLQNIEMIKKFCNEVKIPSCECRNTELVKECLKTFDRVFMSVGSSKTEEYLQWKNNDNLVVLHCVSSYPCPLSIVNLPKLAFLKENFKKIGYSGHYTGVEDAIAAISMGATVIEKHFTLSNKLPGKDNSFALTPDKFNKIKVFADCFQLMNKFHGLDYQESELNERNIHSGRWNNA